MALPLFQVDDREINLKAVLDDQYVDLEHAFERGSYFVSREFINFFQNPSNLNNNNSADKARIRFGEPFNDFFGSECLRRVVTEHVTNQDVRV